MDKKRTLLSDEYIFVTIDCLRYYYVVALITNEHEEQMKTICKITH